MVKVVRRMRRTSRGWVVGALLLGACGVSPGATPCCAQETQADELEAYQLGLGFYERER